MMPRTCSVTLALPICPADWPWDMGISAWIGKDWQDARKKARVITYEPGLKSYSKMAHCFARQTPSCHNMSVDDQPVSICSSRHACFVANESNLSESVCLGDHWERMNETGRHTNMREFQNQVRLGLHSHLLLWQTRSMPGRTLLDCLHGHIPSFYFEQNVDRCSLQRFPLMESC